MRFELRDPAHWEQALTEATADLLSKIGHQYVTAARKYKAAARPRVAAPTTTLALAPPW
jgi:hypothetical protein